MKPSSGQGKGETHVALGQNDSIERGRKGNQDFQPPGNAPSPKESNHTVSTQALTIRQPRTRCFTYMISFNHQNPFK